LINKKKKEVPTPLWRTLLLEHRLPSRYEKRLHKFLLLVSVFLLSVSLKHIYGPRKIVYGLNDVIVLCVVRNGELRINSFIKHYFSLGVKHIVFLDNGSTDSTISIARKYKNVTILRTNLSFKKYKILMKTYLKKRFSKKRWSLVVDIDELFDYPYSNIIGLSSVIDYLNKNRYTTVMSYLLDMFSDIPMSELKSGKNDSIRDLYRYYDLKNIKKRIVPSQDSNEISRGFGMKYLVTGGYGFIGSQVVDKLLEQGHEVIVIDTKETENLAQHKDNKNLTIKNVSICDDLSHIFVNKDIEAVFHLAAIPRVQYSIKNPVETHDVNVNGTVNLLEMSTQFGVKRFIFSSSSSIYGDQETMPLVETMTANPMSPYALQKLIGEQYCKMYYTLYGLKTVSLRYFNVYGPRQDPSGEYATLIAKFIKLINNNQQPIINGDGEQTRDFTYVGDVVEANILAAHTQNQNAFGETFNIGFGRNLSVNQVTQQIIKLSGKDIQPKHGPPVIEPKDTVADVRKVKELLDWIPKVDFEEGLKKTFEFFSEKG